VNATSRKAPAVEQQPAEDKEATFDKSYVNKATDKFVVPGFLYTQRNASANVSLAQGNVTVNSSQNATANVSTNATANATSNKMIHALQKQEHRPHFMSVEKQMELMNRGRKLDKMGSLTRLKAGDTQKNMIKIESLDKLENMDSKENFNKFQKLQNKFDPTV